MQSSRTLQAATTVQPTIARRVADALVPLLDLAFRSGGILSYHAVTPGGTVPSPEMHVSAERLGAQLGELARRFDVVPLHELAARHRHGKSTDRMLAITFDDAYLGVARYAAPILATLDLPATVFVATQPSELRASFWWDELEAARIAAPAGETFARMIDRLGLPSVSPTPDGIAQVREHLLASRAGRAPAPLHDSSCDLPSDLRAMDFDELRMLAADDRFDFGCHTVTHAALPFLGADERAREIADGHQRLMDELPRVRPILAYPFGSYDDDTVEAARSAGMLAAVTLQGRAVTAADHPLMLPRLGVGEDRTVRSIRLRLNGGLRRIMVARTGSLHPPKPADPFTAPAPTAAGRSGTLSRSADA